MQRFWDKVEIIPFHNCWEWIANKHRFGYGKFKYKGKTIPAHRFSYMLANGPIPEGLFICHKCDNPSCVNPAHLFLGTPLDNMRDKISKGRDVYAYGKAVSNFGEKNGFFGKTHSEETKEKIRASNRRRAGIKRK